MYLPRQIEPLLKEYLSAFPAVALTGPRQSGKSTLLQQLLSDYQYVTFDDPNTVFRFNDDPEAFLNAYPTKVIFDEVQRVPDIFHYLKIRIDQNRQAYGQFVLTGSAQFNLISSITESLAGRIGMLTLLPFQYSELPETVLNMALYKGSYPELINRHYRLSDAWYDAYINTYIEKDLRAIQNIGDLTDFRRLLQLLAANTSSELNYSTYANDLGIVVNTVKRWISILEASYIIFTLPPFYENFGKRLTKSPKVYFYDTGLASHLTGIETEKQYEQGPMAGQLFENYVIAEILKKVKHLNLNANLYYLRVHKSTEIDLIVDFKSRRDYIEIKKQVTFNPKMLKHIKSLFENANLKEGDKGYLLYNGDSIPITQQINTIHYRDYLTQQN